jgi:hypothetical protein
MDKKALLDQLQQLPLQERMEIVDSLLDGVSPSTNRRRRCRKSRYARHARGWNTIGSIPMNPASPWTRFGAN